MVRLVPFGVRERRQAVIDQERETGTPKTRKGRKRKEQNTYASSGKYPEYAAGLAKGESRDSTCKVMSDDRLRDGGDG